MIAAPFPVKSVTPNSGKLRFPLSLALAFLFSDNFRNFDCRSRSGGTHAVLARDIKSHDIKLV